jgi:hypothetical protein
MRADDTDDVALYDADWGLPCRVTSAAVVSLDARITQ